MKELTIQEKAEAYDEAVKVIKDNLDALNEITETGVEVVNIQSIKNCFYRAFPVLKENEDERIRKAILELVKQSSGILEKKNQEQMLAWLEKQGEQNLVNTDLDELVIQLEETIGTSPHSRKIIKDFFQKAVQKYMNCLRIANGEIGSLVEENYRLKEKQGEISVRWNENTDGNKPQKNQSVLIKTTHGIAEGEWKGEHWVQYRWSGNIKDSDVLFWIELSDVEKQSNTNETIDTDEFVQGVLKGAAINLITWIDYNVAKGNMCLSNIECKDIEDALVSGDWDKIYAYIKKKLEKQYEKPQGKSAQEAINEKKVDNQNCIKPTNKVEPKFKIEKSKWYVCIKDLLDSYANKAFYKGDTYLSTQDGSLMPSNSNVPFEVVCPDAYFRDWTIQDARDGNILAFDNNTIVMFKDLYNATTFHSYCHIEDGVFTASEKDVLDWWEGKGFHPATKEQRDTLMKAMDDAGFTFNFGKKEKKELKKIEQKTTTWSEEDEDTIKFLISHFCVSHYNRSFQFPNKLITHDELLEKIRNLKPQNTWKPSDEQMLAINTAINVIGKGTLSGKQLIKLQEQLNKLKE